MVTATHTLTLEALGEPGTGAAECLTGPAMPTGVTGLDTMLGGGVPACSVVMLCGPPGAGKTTLAQQMSYSLAATGRKALYLNALSEPLIKLLRDLQGFSFFDPSVFNIGVKYHDLSDAIRNSEMTDAPRLLADLVTQYRPSLLVVDSIKPALETLNNPAMRRRFMYTLTGLSVEAHVVVVLIGEYSESEVVALPEGSTADGIIALTSPFQSPDQRRHIRIIKLRGAPHVQDNWEFAIGPAGIEVFAPAAVARPTPPALSPGGV